MTNTFVLRAINVREYKRYTKRGQRRRCTCASRRIEMVWLVLYSLIRKERQSVNRPRRAASVTASVRLAAPSLVMMEET